MILYDGVVGFVRVNKHPGHDWLDLLVVDPSSQDGVGSQVLRVILGEAKERNVPLWLSVYLTNPARRLYARFGFAERPRDEIRMQMVYPASAIDQPPTC